MEYDKYDLGNAEYAGKAYGGKSLKQELAELIARDVVVPASKLAAIKEEELQRVRDFEAAAEDESRNRRFKTPSAPKEIKADYTREPFIE